MGQYAAFATPTGLWTDFCSLSACQFRATLKWGVPACSAQPYQLEPAILFICTHTHPQSENPSTSLSQFLHFLFHKELKIPNVHKPHIIFTRTPQVSFKSTSSESRILLKLFTNLTSL